MKNQFGRVMLLSCLFFTIGLMSSAQTRIGVKGGLSIPNLKSGNSGNDINSGYGSRLGPDFALFAEFSLSKIFSLQPQIEYSAQGGKKDGVQAFPPPPPYDQMVPPGSYLYANYKSTAKINYLMIPLLVKTRFDLGKSFNAYAAAGPFVSFVLSAKNITRGSSNIYLDKNETQQVTPSPQSFDNDQDIKDELRKANFGIEAAAGFAYSFGQSEIFIEGGGNYGFIKIQKDKANGENNTGAGTVTLGYAFKIGK